MRTYTDPISGDQIDLGERISWLVQGAIRRWPVFLAIQAVFGIWLALGAWTALNLAWSDLAVIIEGIVGIAMFSMARRTAHVAREVREIAQRQQEHLEAVQVHVETMERLERIVCEKLGVIDG